jgi:molecular chaperone GrpE (heat shock protein)
MSRYALPALLVLLLVLLGAMYYDAALRLVDSMPTFSVIGMLDAGLTVSLLGNFILLFIVFSLLKWRQTLSNGMMAIIPSEVMGFFASWTKRLDHSDKQLHGAVLHLQQSYAQTSKHIPTIAESIDILKKTLDEKDRELAALKATSRTDEQIALSKKAIKLHHMMSGLKASLERKQVTDTAALAFLAEELEAVFDELHITLINPEPGTALNKLPPDSVSIREKVPTPNQATHNSVAGVVEPGYAFALPDNRVQVLRPAVVTVNIFGGADGDRRD